MYAEQNKIPEKRQKTSKTVLLFRGQNGPFSRSWLQ